MRPRLKLSERCGARKPTHHLIVLALFSLTVMTLSLPVQAQTTAPTVTPTLGPDGASVSLYLPPEPPTASVEVDCGLPGDGDWCRMPITVRLFGHAAGSPIARLDYQLDDEQMTAPGDFFRFEAGVNGEHTVTLTATDFLGRQSIGASRSFKVDRSLPRAVFAGYDHNLLNLAISDEGSGVVQWTVQIFDGKDQSVFYEDGNGPFAGALSWVAAPDLYQIELFIRDAAGNESHFPRTVFAVASPSPVSVFEQVFGLFTVRATATPKPTTVSVTPVPILTSTLRATRIPLITTLSPVATLLPSATATQPNVSVTPVPVISEVTRWLTWLSLLALLALLVVWCTGAAFDRRASALEALSVELSSLLAGREREVRQA